MLSTMVGWEIRHNDSRSASAGEKEFIINPVDQLGVQDFPSSAVDADDKDPATALHLPPSCGNAG